MNNVWIGAPIALLAVAILALAFVLATSVGGEAATQGASPAGTAAGFRVQHVAIDSTEVVPRDEGCSPEGHPFGISGSPGCSRWYGSFHLPDGSRITQMDVLYEDNSASKDLTISISSSALDGTADAGTGFRFDSTGSPGQVSDSMTDEAVVDNENNHYRVSVSLREDPDLSFISALITFEEPAFVAGDVDCSGSVDPIDSLKVLRHDAALPVSQTQPCPPIGQ